LPRPRPAVDPRPPVARGAGPVPLSPADGPPRRPWRRCGPEAVETAAAPGSPGEGAGDGEAVLVDVVPGDEPVLDGEVQREPGAVGAAGRLRGLPDLAERPGVLAVHQDPLGVGRRVLRPVVPADL